MGRQYWIQKKQKVVRGLEMEFKGASKTKQQRRFAYKAPKAAHLNIRKKVGHIHMPEPSVPLMGDQTSPLMLSPLTKDDVKSEVFEQPKLPDSGVSTDNSCASEESESRNATSGNEYKLEEQSKLRCLYDSNDVIDVMSKYSLELSGLSNNETNALNKSQSHLHQNPFTAYTSIKMEPVFNTSIKIKPNTFIKVKPLADHPNTSIQIKPVFSTPNTSSIKIKPFINTPFTVSSAPLSSIKPHPIRTELASIAEKPVIATPRLTFKNEPFVGKPLSEIYKSTVYSTSIVKVKMEPKSNVSASKAPEPNIAEESGIAAKNHANNIPSANPIPTITHYEKNKNRNNHQQHKTFHRRNNYKYNRNNQIYRYPNNYNKYHSYNKYNNGRSNEINTRFNYNERNNANQRNNHQNQYHTYPSNDAYNNCNYTSSNNNLYVNNVQGNGHFSLDIVNLLERNGTIQPWYYDPIVQAINTLQAAYGKTARVFGWNNGHLQVDGLSSDNRDMLISCVQEISRHWNGECLLAAIRRNSFRTYRRVCLLISGSLPNYADFMHRVGYQNHGLNIAEWRFIDSCYREYDNVRLNFFIDGDSFNEMRSNRGYVSYAFGRLLFNLYPDRPLSQNSNLYYRMRQNNFEKLFTIGPTDIFY